VDLRRMLLQAGYTPTERSGPSGDALT
jgi:hypothetical protein